MSDPASPTPAPAFPEARYTFRLLRAGRFHLDGGSMFGLIPRSVWSRSVLTDAKGRIEVQHNCLLLDRAPTVPPTGPPVGVPLPLSPPSSSLIPLPSSLPHRLLIETGSGDKLDAKMRDIFDFEANPATGRQRSIIDALAEVCATPESIDAIAVSHLHFDHAGGLTRLARPGETPTWPVPPHDDGGGGSYQTAGCLPTFPNARIYVQEREWRDALINKSVMTRTYFPDHLHPIAPQLSTVDSPRPFPPGLAPGRDDLPLTPLAYRLTELWKGGGVYAFNVPGHTWGQQAILFREPEPPAGLGRTVVFVPDVMPTIHHVGAAYSLGYDVEPYTSMLTRRWLLTEAAANDWLLCLDHEPGNPLVRVRPNARGWFDLVPG